MSIDRVRHGRQIRLPEIGEAGQERLVTNPIVLLGAGDAREIEASYLARAGVRVVDDAGVQAKAKAKSLSDGSAKLHDEITKALGMRDVAAAEVADGALRALLAMRKILGIDRGGGGGG
jgi:hypothetical protein